MRLIVPTWLASLCLCLVSCGGGGGGDEGGGGDSNPPPVLQTQTIAFAQPGSVSTALLDGNFANAASGGAGTGAITYQSSNNSIATVSSSGMVTFVAAGTVQITATKAADASYQSATATYTLTIAAPDGVPFTASIGDQDTQLAFPSWAAGLEFLRSTQPECNVAQFSTCANNKSDTLTAAGTITDDAAKFMQPATYWLRKGTATSTPSLISQFKFLGRSRLKMASFRNKLWIVGGQQTDIALKSDVWSSDDGITWSQATPDAGFAVRSNHQLVAFNDRLWVLGGEAAGITVNEIYRNDVWSSADGVSWRLETAAAQWAGRFAHAAVAFNGKLWVIGGLANNTWPADVWSSTDGISWTLVTNAAPFGGRSGHSVTVFNGKMWLLGNGPTNDVWSSADGATWVQETASAPFPSRGLHVAVAANGRLWVIGGVSDNLPYLHEVWSSADGIDWIQETAAAPFAARINFAAATLNDRVFIAGGEYATTSQSAGTLTLFFTDDVWSSADGRSWTLMTHYGPFAPGTQEVQAFNGKLWVLGGTDGSASRNDVWSSSNGANWKQASSTQVFSPRLQAASTVFNNRLWIVGGVPKGSNPPASDVWHSDDGTTWVQDTANANFGVRLNHALVTFNGQMLLIGGADLAGKHNDVWSSADGVTWTQITAAAGFSARSGAHAAVMNGRVWLAGGTDTMAGTLTDVWSSSDGINWQLATPSVAQLEYVSGSLVAHSGKLWLTGRLRYPQFSTSPGPEFSRAIWSSADGVTWAQVGEGGYQPRADAAFVSFNDALWVIGGRGKYAPKNDVWASTDGVRWRLKYQGTIAYP